MEQKNLFADHLDKLKNHPGFCKEEERQKALINFMESLVDCIRRTDINFVLEGSSS